MAAKEAKVNSAKNSKPESVCSDSSDGDYTEANNTNREDRDTRYRDQVVMRYK